MGSQSRYFPLLLSLLAGFLLVAPTQAGEYTPWGIALVVGAADSPEISRQQPGLEANRQLEATRERLDTAVRQQGPYDSALAESLLAAAYEADEYGALERALTWYQAALFNTRVNRGLYAAEQLPILESMLSILRRQGDPQALADRIDYYYHLLGQGARPYSDERLMASERWLRVNVELLAGEDTRGRASQALRVWEHGDRLADAVCTDVEWGPTWCKPLTLQLVALLYVIDFYIDPLVSEQSGTGMTHSRAMMQREWDLPPGEQRLYTLERSAGAKGTSLLERALTWDVNDAELLLAKADWAWFLGKRGQALDDYRRLAAEHAEWFAEPVPLPAVPLISRDPRLTEQPALLSVTVTVSTSGRPRDVVVTGGEDYDPDPTATARRQIRNLRFRPALDEQGEAVERKWTAAVTLLR